LRLCFTSGKSGAQVAITSPDEIHLPAN